MLPVILLIASAAFGLWSVTGERERATLYYETAELMRRNGMGPSAELMLASFRLGVVWGRITLVASIFGMIWVIADRLLR